MYPCKNEMFNIYLNIYFVDHQQSTLKKKNVACLHYLLICWLLHVKHFSNKKWLLTINGVCDNLTVDGQHLKKKDISGQPVASQHLYVSNIFVVIFWTVSILVIVVDSQHCRRSKIVDGQHLMNICFSGCQQLWLNLNVDVNRFVDNLTVNMRYYCLKLCFT